MLHSVIEKPRLAELNKPDAKFNKLVLTFKKNGYLQIHAIADEVEVALIRFKLEAMWTSKTGFDQGYQFDLVGEDDENNVLAFPQIIHPITFAPELLKTKFFADAQAIVRTLLGPKAKFSSDHALLKNR